jgi:hypothetical protein
MIGASRILLLLILLIPFCRVQAGDRLSFSSNIGPAFNLGAGFEYISGKHTTLFASLRYEVGFIKGDAIGDLPLKLGMTLR